MEMNKTHNVSPNTNLVQDKTTRIYINPKFNVPTATRTSISMLQQKQNVHINPLFRNVEPIKQNSMNKTTIHVNPNFVPIKSQTGAVQTNSISTQMLYDVQADKSTLNALKKSNENKFINKSRYKLTRTTEARSPLASYLVQNKINSTLKLSDIVQADKSTSNALKKPKDNKLNTTVNKSRYKLTRKIETRSTPANQPSTSRKTVKVNKYKLITLSNIEKDKHMVKIHRTFSNFKYTKLENKLKQSKQINRKISNNALNIKYHAIKHTDPRIQNVKVSPSPKVILDKTINSKRAYSKNCIPCPLFRKYGRCIRYEKGSCLYVHDKKHVSICRKFLKGMCRDADCLHSHEVTLKKMPLCYFYSKGACTKPDCPYLHVKLNDKTKICSSFQKGYCEMGDKCLHRHIDKSTSLSMKKTLKKTDKSRKESKKTNKKTLQETESIKKQSTQLSQNKCVQDRYYSDVVEVDPNNKDSGEVIKPTRCKLGDLPSFIHL